MSIDYKREYIKYKSMYLKLKQNGGVGENAGFILIEENYYGQPCLIMFRRASDGVIELPGGLSDPTDPTPLYTATRELREESNGMFSFTPSGTRSIMPKEINFGANAKTYIVRIIGPPGGIRSRIYDDNYDIYKNRTGVPNGFKETDMIVRVPLDQITVINLNDKNHIYNCLIHGGSIQLRMRNNSINVLLNAINQLNHGNKLKKDDHNIPVRHLVLDNINNPGHFLHGTQFYRNDNQR